MSFGQPFSSVTPNAGTVPFKGAANGLSVDAVTGKVIFGGTGSNLLSNRSLTMGAFTMTFTGGSGSFVINNATGEVLVRHTSASGRAVYRASNDLGTSLFFGMGGQLDPEYDDKAFFQTSAGEMQFVINQATQPFIYKAGGAQILKIDENGLLTGTPGGSGAGLVKFGGRVAAAAPTLDVFCWEVKIGGTLRKVALLT